MRQRVCLYQSRCTTCGKVGFLLEDKDVLTNLQRFKVYSV
jgi:hypothetical protein